MRFQIVSGLRRNKNLHAALILGTFAVAAIQLPAQFITNVTWQAATMANEAVEGKTIQQTPAGLTMSGQQVPLKLEKTYDGPVLANAIKMFKTQPGTLAGGRYKTHVPGTTKFSGGNTLCGPKDINYIVLLTSKTPTTDGTRDLHFALFSGTQPPDLTPAALSKSTTFCGTAHYTTK